MSPMDRPASRLWLPLLLLLLAAGAAAWWWTLRGEPPEAASAPAVDPVDQRLLALEQALAGLSRGQARSEQRLADLEARGKVLRDELLGLGQRLALLDESVQQLAAQAPGAAPGVRLRLDEVELLLSFAEARIALGGDVEGARRAYELADGLLSALTAPQYVNLRQSLAQEQAALAALPPDPRIAAQAAVDAVERALPALEGMPALRPAPAAASPFERLLSALVDVRPRGEQDLLAPADRQRGEAALRLELALLRSAIRERDAEAVAAASARAAGWMRRLYAEGPALQAELSRLDGLARAPLGLDLPVLGSTLAQLRAQRRAGGEP